MQPKPEGAFAQNRRQVGYIAAQQSSKPHHHHSSWHVQQSKAHLGNPICAYIDDGGDEHRHAPLMSRRIRSNAQQLCLPRLPPIGLGLADRGALHITMVGQSAAKCCKSSFLPEQGCELSIQEEDRAKQIADMTTPLRTFFPFCLLASDLQRLHWHYWYLLAVGTTTVVPNAIAFTPSGLRLIRV